jgi:sodium-dependent dicarboxylate transporter 2/3/5
MVVPILYLILDLFFGFTAQSPNPKATLTILMGAWMVLWWVFEILPLGVTALIPLFFLPFLGILPLKEVTPAYSNPVIFLFLGGFIIARALEKTRLDERLALTILLRSGHSDRGIILGFIVGTTFLSMWISNTATTVMMVPIAMAVTDFLKNQLEEDQKPAITPFSTCLFLAIAYSANIGGVMTPIGTPPNVVFMGYLNDLYQRDIGFDRWILATAPLALALLTSLYFLLRWVHPFSITLPHQFQSFIHKRHLDLGARGSSQNITIFVFALAASLWVFKGLIHWAVGVTFINDTSVALFCGVLLFLIPSHDNKNYPVLAKEDIAQLPWDIVLLFGGGMALANALKEAGLIEIITQFYASQSFSKPYFLIGIMTFLALFLTEVMSNVALCVVALPLIMKLGESQGIDPVLMAMPAALCTSFAFSMPISTPPNAIVFGTNAVRVKDMLKVGLILNFVAFGLTMSLGYLMIGWVLA